MNRVGMVPGRDNIVDYIIEKKIVPQEDIIYYFNRENKYNSEELIFEVNVAIEKFNRSNKVLGKQIRNVEGYYTYFEEWI